MDAQYTLGGLFVEGVGVVADEAQAARWFGEAARNGHVGAQVEYAILLFNGRGVPKDEAGGRSLVPPRPRTPTIPSAQVRLARLLAEGRGVDEDPRQAARWYLIAKDRGLEDDFMEDWLSKLDAARANGRERGGRTMDSAQRRRPVQAAAATPTSDARRWTIRRVAVYAAALRARRGEAIRHFRSARPGRTRLVAGTAVRAIRRTRPGKGTESTCRSSSGTTMSTRR